MLETLDLGRLPLQACASAEFRPTRKYSATPTIGSKSISAIQSNFRITPELPINTLTMAKMSKSRTTAPTRLIAIEITM
jgi:hypothetical protein